LKLSEILFKLQSYTPIPFILVAWLYAQADQGLQIFGGLLIFVGFLLRFSAAAYLNKESLAKEILVTDGPYAFIRNPRYFGNILILTGTVIAGGGLLPHLLWITIIYFSFQYIGIARYEENLLDAKFGDKFELYTDLVPRYYPRLSPYPGREHIKSNFGAALNEEKNALIILLVLVILFYLRWYIITF
jgi:protein-S-isoprenylcysteine O-methyltransferase Ste14